MLPKELLYAPSVFAVGKNYQICVAASCEGTAYVTVGGRSFYDASNGILRSKKYLHKVTVPMKALDEAKEYTLVFRQYTDRKPYRPDYCEPVSITVPFRPVGKDAEKVNIYHISDTHGESVLPVKTGSYFGENLDVLILNGDIADHSGDAELFKNIYKIAGEITKGEIPCVFSRGNHDLRGSCAEILCDYTPCKDGLSYYTFRLGCIWGIILDCGEDKDDSHVEYGYSVACHDFRLTETDFIKEVIENKEKEYAEEDVKFRIVVSHVPFGERFPEPFNPEEEIYTEWCRLLREYIKPELAFSGHTHRAALYACGSEKDNFGQPCPVVVGSEPKRDKAYKLCGFVGAGVTLGEGSDEVVFSDENGTVLCKYVIKK